VKSYEYKSSYINSVPQNFKYRSEPCLTKHEFWDGGNISYVRLVYINYRSSATKSHTALCCFLASFFFVFVQMNFEIFKDYI